MYCTRCGKQITEGSMYCEGCGNKVQQNDFQMKESNNSLNTKKTIPYSRFIKLGCILLGLTIGVGSISILSKVKKEKSWNTWIQNYEKSLEENYISDEYKLLIEENLKKADSLKNESEQQVLKQTLEALELEVINQNKSLLKEIEAEISFIEQQADLEYAHEDEKEKISELKEEISGFKTSKEYNKAIEKIEECKNLIENISEIKTGWDVTVLQKDISDYPKIKLYLDIRDAEGAPINQLDKDIFFLSHKEASSGAYVKHRIIDAMQLDKNESININLVADLSGSMEADISSVKGIMNNFLNTVQFGVGDKIALTTFSDTSSLVQNFSSNKEQIRSSINSMGTYGGTKLYDTLIEATLKAYSQSGAKCVIAFTDGQDNRSASSYKDVIRVANNTGVPIFIIGIGYDIDQTVLSQIAASTGGAYSNVANIGSSMQAIYDSIYTKQKQVYCLQYETHQQNIMADENLELYIRGDNGGAKLNYTFVPADDSFNILLNNYLNSYVEALMQGDPSIMAKSGCIDPNGGVYKETKAYIESYKEKLKEQLLEAQVTNIKAVDDSTYDITSHEIYDVEMIKNYNKEIMNSNTSHMKTVKELLLQQYSEGELIGKDIVISKQIKLNGYYRLKKSKDGRWQITEYTDKYEGLGTFVYGAYIQSYYN